MGKIILFVVVFCTIVLAATAQNNKVVNFQLSFISPFGTNGFQSHLVTNRVSVNLLGGHSYGNTTAEFGGLYNVNMHLTKGVQFAGIVNYSGRAENATQFAGIANVTTKGTVAAQIGGIANVAETAAVQIGGIINVAKRVTGIQIGLINYADTCEGVAVGLVNIVKKGGKHEFEISLSEALNTAVSFKLGTNKLYTIFSVGINYLNNPVQYAYGFGMGTHQKWKNNWGSQVEVIGYQLTEDGKFRGGLDLLTLCKFAVSKQIANHFKLFAGPVFNMTISDYINPKTNKTGSSLAPYTMWEHTSGKTNLKAWVGFAAGMRF